MTGAHAVSAAWSRGRRRASVAAVAGAICCLLARAGRTATPPHVVTIDRTVARFYAPETGGAAYPRFVLERTLAFEARLAKMADTTDGVGESYGERDVRDAFEQHVSEEILSSLADKLIADSPPDKRPSAGDLAAVERDVGGAFVERMGGRERVDSAARAEQINRTEVDAILRRGALAAWYLDRAVTPLLHATEEQLREVFQSSAHPYRGQTFEQARAGLERWFISERVRVAEGAFLQAARSRVRIILTP